MSGQDFPGKLSVLEWTTCPSCGADTLPNYLGLDEPCPHCDGDPLPDIAITADGSMLLEGYLGDGGWIVAIPTEDPARRTERDIEAAREHARAYVGWEYKLQEGGLCPVCGLEKPALWWNCPPQDDSEDMAVLADGSLALKPSGFGLREPITCEACQGTVNGATWELSEDWDGD